MSKGDIRIMKRKQVLALLIAVAMTANMTMPAFAATAPVSGSIFWGSEETVAITEDDLAAAMAAAVKGTDAVSEGAEKEETVYVFTDANGKQKSMTVSNWLKNKDGADKLYDNSILQNIENVKGDEPFTQNGDILTWNAGGNDIYYQGTTDKAAPITQKITYYLDGKEIAPEDLAGKSGKVKIHIDYDNSEKYSDVFVPFTTMTGIIFSNDNVKNVEVDNGSVISEGKNTVVVGMAFPGLSDSLQSAKDDAEHLLDETEASQKSKDRVRDLEIPDSVEITMDATDFKMSTCMTMVFSGLFDDDEELEEDHDSMLKDMDEKIADLEKDGADLADGAGKLSDGINEATDGSKELADGAGELASGIKEYTDGVSEVNDGAQQIDAGVGTLVDRLPDLTKGASTLSSGLTEFGGGVSELTGGLGTLKAGTQQLADQSQALNDGVAKLSEGAVKLQTGIKNYTGGVENLKAGTSEMLAKDKLPLLSTTAKSVSEGFDKYVGGVSDAAGQIYDGADAIAKSAGNVPDAVDAVNKAVAGISAPAASAESVVKDIKTVKSNVEDAEKEINGITEVAEISGTDVTNAASAAASETSEKHKINKDDVDVDINANVSDAVRSKVMETLDGYDLTDEQIEDIADEAANAAQEAANDSVTYIIDVKPANEKLGKAINDAAYAGASAMADDAGGRISDAKTKANAAKGSLSSLTREEGTIGSLEGNAKTVNEGIGDVGSAVGSLYGKLTALKNGMSQLSTGATQLQGAAQAVQTNSNNLKAGAKAVYDGIGAYNDSGIWGGVTDLQRGLVQLTGNNTELNKKAAMMSAGLSHVPANENETPGLAQGLAAYTAGVSDVNSGVQKLYDGAKILNGSMQTILDGTKKLDAGAKTLSAGASKLSGGVSDLADGTEKLDENSGKLRNGASQLSEGAAKLADGMSEISSGALELKDGCIKLNEEGVQKLAKLYKTDVKSIEKRIDTLKDAAKSYKTFSGTANPDKTRVKFIYKTDSIEKKD